MNPLLLVRAARFALAGTLFLTAIAASGGPGVSHAAPVRAGMRTITITAAHPVFPRNLPAGMLAARLVTDASTPYAVGFLRLNPGVSIARAQAASADVIRLSRLVTFVGGEVVPAQRSATAIVNLGVPGRYAMHISGKEGDPGRTLLFAVTSVAAQPPALIRADVTVTLNAARFVGLPTAIHAGVMAFKVTDVSSGVRNMQIWRLAPGKTQRDFIGAFNRRKDPAWLHIVGGMDLLSPHQTAWMTLKLAPGTYIAECPLPNPNTGGRAFALEGMIATFTVS